MTQISSTKPVGRPRSFDQGTAIDRAMRVFWERGYEGASLKELTAAMGIKPASLYGAFGNKQELFRQALKHYLATEVAFVQDVFTEETAFRVAQRLLRESAVFLTRPGFPHGCMTVQTSLAITEEGAQVHRDLVNLRVTAQKTLKDRFARAKREGDLPADASPKSLARFVVSVYQAMTVQAVSGASRKDLLDLAETAMKAWPPRS